MRCGRGLFAALFMFFRFIFRFIFIFIFILFLIVSQGSRISQSKSMLYISVTIFSNVFRPPSVHLRPSPTLSLILESAPQYWCVGLDSAFVGRFGQSRSITSNTTKTGTDHSPIIYCPTKICPPRSTHLDLPPSILNSHVVDHHL